MRTDPVPLVFYPSDGDLALIQSPFVLKNVVWDPNCISQMIDNEVEFVYSNVYKHHDIPHTWLKDESSDVKYTPQTRPRPRIGSRYQAHIPHTFAPNQRVLAKKGRMGDWQLHIVLNLTKTGYILRGKDSKIKVFVKYTDSNEFIRALPS